ncbi:pilin [Patescibacteria group bacterium AH-259-L05]|nr:pilin [Patescibacteria group bacterium AH-259-L05]
MFSKKIILIFAVLLLLFLISSVVYAFPRAIGGDRYSDCIKQEDGTWKCNCQGGLEGERVVGGNVVEGGELGWLMRDPICVFCGDCDLSNFLALGVNIAKIILRYLGVFALLMFIIGGVIWITSGGSTGKVQLGKKIISGAVVGMVIVLGAVAGIRVLGTMFGVEEEYVSFEVPERPELPIEDVEGPGFLGDIEDIWEPEPDTFGCFSPVQDAPTTYWCHNCVSPQNEDSLCWRAQIVKNYQRALEDMGCDCKWIDGKFGSQTEICTINFKKSYNRFYQEYGFKEESLFGLAENGIVDEYTYKYAMEVDPSMLLDIRKDITNASCK